MSEVYYICALDDRKQTEFLNFTGLSIWEKKDGIVSADPRWVLVGNDEKFTGIGEKYDYGFKVLSKRFDLKDRDIIVFIHQDIRFDRTLAEEKIKKTFAEHENLRVLGVYGTETWNGGGWWNTDREKSSHGQIIQTNNGKPFLSKHQSGFYDNLVCVDGCFLCSTVQNVREVGWKGSVSGWHQYDNDFCFRTLVNTDGDVGVFDLVIEHRSGGEPNDEWAKQSNKIVDWFKSIGMKSPITKENINGYKNNLCKS